MAPTIDLPVPDQLQKILSRPDSDRATFVVRSDAMDDQSAAGDCTAADRSSSPWQLCWYFCWYSLNQHLDKTKKSLKKSSFIWRLPGPPRFALRATRGAATRGRRAKRGVRRSLSKAKAKTDWAAAASLPTKISKTTPCKVARQLVGNVAQAKPHCSICSSYGPSTDRPCFAIDRLAPGAGVLRPPHNNRPLPLTDKLHAQGTFGCHVHICEAV